MDVTFIQELNKLYPFLEVIQHKVPNVHACNYDHPSSIPMMPFFRCPVCDADLKQGNDTILNEKDFYYDDFPYFPPRSSEALNFNEDLKIGHVSIFSLLPKELRQDYRRLEVSTRVNHSGTTFSILRFNMYEGLMKHFSRSPYFDRNILEDLFSCPVDDRPPYSDIEVYLTTSYCEYCSNDIYLSIDSSSYQDLLVGRERLTAFQMKYIYTMIANAVAFTTSFSQNGFHRTLRANQTFLSTTSFKATTPPTEFL